MNDSNPGHYPPGHNPPGHYPPGQKPPPPIFTKNLIDPFVQQAIF